MIEIVKLTADEWNAISEETMRYAFNESGWDKDFNRVDYVVVAQDKESKRPFGFATIIEMDKQTAYIQSGGTFPHAQGSAIGGRGFLKIIDFLRHNYFHVQMRVRSTNFPMLKLALKAGFVTCGTHLDKLGVLYLTQDLVETHG